MYIATVVFLKERKGVFSKFDTLAFWVEIENLYNKIS